jgi:acylglycerol lipase
MLFKMEHSNKVITTIIAILSTMIANAAKPFALEKLEFLKSFPVKSPEYIQASDGYNLAYYAFVPEAPKAMIIFYHGAGFYGSALYQYFAAQFAEKHNIGCYLFDIRGHDNSEGARGDTPSIKQV